jgi:DNA-binding CsgD family transcriptional regulator
MSDVDVGPQAGLAVEIREAERPLNASAANAHLRPIERRIRHLVANGTDISEVAWRFRRSPRSVSHILAMSELPRKAVLSKDPAHTLRPIERRILTWRETGASYAEIGARFRRSPQFIRQVEALAIAKLDRGATRS